MAKHITVTTVMGSCWSKGHRASCSFGVAKAPHHLDHPLLGPPVKSGPWAFVLVGVGLAGLPLVLPARAVPTTQGHQGLARPSHDPELSSPSCRNRSGQFCAGMDPMAFRWSEDRVQPSGADSHPRRCHLWLTPVCCVATNPQAQTSASPQHKASCDTRISSKARERGSGLLEF